MQGKLLEDEDIIKVINEFFAQSSLDDCVLDGFPRTIKQAQWLMAQHNTGTLNIKAVVHLTASKNIVKKRLLARGRPDDTEYAIDVRFNEYETHTLPIVDWFKKEKITLHEVDGERSIEQIHQDIIKRLSVLDAVSD
jgi:adenylate kinase